MLPLDQKYWQRLRDKATELIELYPDKDGSREVVLRFAKQFLKAAVQPEVLLTSIARVAIECLRMARLDASDAVAALVVGKGPPDDDGRRPKMIVQIAFDLDEVTLYTREARAHLTDLLVERDALIVDSRNMIRCSLSGVKAERQMGSFPDPRLPVLNKRFPLFSMFSDAQCNSRYGLTDWKIVPVAKEAALRMQDALKFIVDKSREGMTWRGVASGKFEGKKEMRDLLVAYVDGKPSIAVASIFGANANAQAKQFEADAKSVCDALDGLVREEPMSRLNLFVLRKASEGQAFVTIAESPSVADVLKAARRWQEGARNIPEVTLPLSESKGSPIVNCQPHPPYPDQVVRLLAEQWVTNGTRANKAQGIGLGQVLDLMLRKPGRWNDSATHMLNLTTVRLSPLLIGISKHASDISWKDYPSSSRKVALLAVGVLGILLDALDRKKEVYMIGTAFLIGQLLSRADTLHREYCRLVRRGSIPPQLIGNSLMPVAADNPQDAVDRLRERMHIYRAWADKNDGKDFALAKWSVSQMGKLTRELAEQLPLRTQTDAAFRAELFLGYMARPPKADRPPDGPEQSSTTEGENHVNE